MRNIAGLTCLCFLSLVAVLAAGSAERHAVVISTNDSADPAIDTGADPSLPPLPAGVDKLTARIQQLQTIAAELKKARTLYTEKHPRVVKLTEAMKLLGKPLASDIAAKLDKLQAADTKLAAIHKEAHPQRQALAKQIALLRKAQASLPAVPVVPPRELTLDLGKGISMKLVLIPAGKFLMGSPDSEKGRSPNEGPQHEVMITKPFYMGIYEVTQAQYEQVTGKNPSSFKGAQNPVEHVSCDDATEFCKKLSQKTGKMVSLPTEAQWEYACRSGSKTRFHFGDRDEDLSDYGWWGYDKGNSDKQTHPVGGKKPNAFGLHDMHGNVWEWCSDWYVDSYANLPTGQAGAKNQDPSGPNSGTLRVLRGGGWDIKPAICRSARRVRRSPDLRLGDSGFRVSVALPAGQAGLK